MQQMTWIFCLINPSHDDNAEENRVHLMNDDRSGVPLKAENLETWNLLFVEIFSSFGERNKEYDKINRVVLVFFWFAAPKNTFRFINAFEMKFKSREFVRAPKTTSKKGKKQSQSSRRWREKSRSTRSKNAVDRRARLSAIVIGPQTKALNLLQFVVGTDFLLAFDCDEYIFVIETH